MESRIRWLSFTLYTLFWFTLSVTEVPNIALIERAICIREHQNPDVDEAVCKGSHVQAALSRTLGWKLAFNSLAGLLTAIFYGFVAERLGKKLVIALSTCGLAIMTALDIAICSNPLTIPISAIWVSSGLLLIGGGQRVYMSMIYALVSDSLESESRTLQLYLLGLGSNIVKFIDPRIAAGLMQVDLRAPFYVSFAIWGLILILLTLMSEPQISDAKNQYENEYTPINTGGQVPENLAIPVAQTASLSNTTSLDSHGSPENNADGRSRFSKARSELSAFYVLFGTPASFYCLSAMLLKRIGFASSVFLSQYASEKFKWALHETTWLRVSSSGAAILIYTILPLVNRWLVKRGNPHPLVELNTIRGSLLVLAVSFFEVWSLNIGWFMILASFGMGLGEALLPALQNLLTFATDAQRNTRVFTVIALADTLAELIAGPLMAALMDIGRTSSHPSNGLCFLASSSLFGILLLWAFLFKIPNERARLIPQSELEY